MKHDQDWFEKANLGDLMEWVLARQDDPILWAIRRAYYLGRKDGTESQRHYPRVEGS